jgi:hypothetical protein
MTMRRFGLLMLALTVAVPVAGLAVLARTEPARVARAAVAVLEALAPSRAIAQSTMQFKPVPPESTTILERERPLRHRSRATTDVTEPAPAANPSVPPPPEPPEEPVPSEQVTRAGDITRVSGDIHVEKDEVVRGDITAIKGDVTVDGTVHGDVVSLAGDIYLNATARVEGSVVCVGGELHEEPGAYVSGERVTALGARGEALARHMHIRALERAQRDLGGYPRRAVRALVGLLIMAGLALLVVWLFRRRIEVGAETLRRHPAVSLGLGALVHALFVPSVIALVLVVALLCITIIGIPLALAALLGYFLFFVVFWVFGLVIGAVVIGQWITARSGTAALPLWQTVLLGVLILGGARFVGRLLQGMGVVGLGGLGTAVMVLSILAIILLGTMGGGAWLKWEFSEGLFGRWRGRWENRGQRAAVQPGPYGPPPASPYGPPAATATVVEPTPAPSPPGPPAAPESYMPPGQAPPPEPTPGA